VPQVNAGCPGLPVHEPGPHDLCCASGRPTPKPSAPDTTLCGQGVFAPLGFTLSPAIGALSMAGSSVIVAVNALLLKRLRLPQSPGHADQDAQPAEPAGDQRGTAGG